jgi:NMD protein affecting ribosome stability and mRNA decay
MPRQLIVDKLNELSEFELSKEEIKFIVENWISSHIKHKSKVDITNAWDQKSGVDLKINVKLDRSSSYKYF